MRKYTQSSDQIKEKQNETSDCMECDCGEFA